MCERGQPRQIAAESVYGNGIGAIQTADEIRNGIRGVDEPAIHVVAGIEEHEYVGADEGVRAQIGYITLVRPNAVAAGDWTVRQERARGTVVQQLHGWFVAFAEGVDLLRNAILENAEI